MIWPKDQPVAIAIIWQKPLSERSLPISAPLPSPLTTLFCTATGMQGAGVAGRTAQSRTEHSQAECERAERLSLVTAHKPNQKEGYTMEEGETTPS